MVVRVLPVLSPRNPTRSLDHPKEASSTTGKPGCEPGSSDCKERLGVALRMNRTGPRQERSPGSGEAERQHVVLKKIIQKSPRANLTSPKKVDEQSTPLSKVVDLGINR